jgi:hypothetical protein
MEGCFKNANLRSESDILNSLIVPRFLNSSEKVLKAERNPDMRTTSFELEMKFPDLEKLFEIKGKPSLIIKTSLIIVVYLLFVMTKLLKLIEKFSN